jgi:hypothetical protein
MIVSPSILDCNIRLLQITEFPLTVEILILLSLLIQALSLIVELPIYTEPDTSVFPEIIEPSVTLTLSLIFAEPVTLEPFSIIAELRT